MKLTIRAFLVACPARGEPGNAGYRFNPERVAHVHARWGHFLRWTALVLAGLSSPSRAVGAADAKGKPKGRPRSPGPSRSSAVDQRLSPQPRARAAARGLRAMRDLLLLKDVEQSGIYVGFVAGVIGANPDKAETLISDMFPMPPPDQVRRREGDRLFGPFRVEGAHGQVRRAHAGAASIVIERYLYGKLPVLRDLPLDSPIAVDANWGYYFATGSSEPIQRLVRTLAWSKDRDNVEKLTIGSMVKWTLAQNASRDTRAARLPEDLAAASAGGGGSAARRDHRGGRDLRARADPQGCHELHRGAQDEGLRNRTATSPGGARRVRRCLRWAASAPLLRARW